ncbi:hypothetical protein [Paracoccus marinaquae]|uniref:Uncharacterized protein n=1 Tax=Paracoccus marinaquae TaxID=2841926 RepID=A0ABS6AH85_9RHOB|nr:hypothetical protein [Paracoccus marinaquae]MBU3029883.1 hypothetical protein [Paracoccus marinaquae]
MDDRQQDKPGQGETREDRLRAALRANLQRRKAQARVRAGRSDQENETGSETGGDDS